MHLLFYLLAIISVSNQTDLNKAVSNAKAGDTIKLAAGNYGVFVVNNTQFDKPVTITSADPKHPAVFNKIALNNSKNITFSNVEVYYPKKPTDPNYDISVRINGGSDITLDNIYVHGTLNGSLLDDISGIDVAQSDNFTIADSKLEEVYVGIKVRRSKNVNIRNNEITMIGADALEIPATDGINIYWNKFSKFRTVNGVHPDNIQCWTTNETVGCKNVRIIGNQFLGDFNTQSTGYAYPQGIFFGDEARVAGYENIEITGNLFVCNSWHAINMYSQPKNVVLRFNKVQSCPGYDSWFRIDAPALLEGNIVPLYYINSTVAMLPQGNFIGGSASK